MASCGHGNDSEEYSTVLIRHTAITMHYRASHDSCVPCGAPAPIGPWPPLSGFSDLIRHMLGLVWRSDLLVAKDNRTQDNITNIHAPSGIRTRDSSNLAAKIYALSRGHRDRKCMIVYRHKLLQKLNRTSWSSD
jgi:hypothetical protein